MTTLIDLGDPKKRKRITPAKTPLLEAIQIILEERKAFLPLSVRQVHYALLNNPPLKHASKPDSCYHNDKRSYNALVDVLTRARVVGIIPHKAIDDATRPVTTWPTRLNAQDFIGSELDGFLQNYWRDLQQSQPDHIEIIVEKNTIGPLVRDIALEFCIPLTSGHGYCSLPPRKAIVDRFHASGKDRLVLVILGDFDPDGLDIASSFVASLQGDFHVPKDRLVAICAALTAEQIQEYKLPVKMKAKKSSTSYNKFFAQHGDNVFELEAIEPKELQRLTTEAVESVLDRGAFDAEIKAEAADIEHLKNARQQVEGTLSGLLE